MANITGGSEKNVTVSVGPLKTESLADDLLSLLFEILMRIILEMIEFKIDNAGHLSSQARDFCKTLLVCYGPFLLAYLIS
ncbi:MAG: hypothetical protein KKB51_10880 [Candidatus Riflebacteria bacterium]|nr:hypothetical protein [Candidatus Riflebacteria bacterium]